MEVSALCGWGGMRGQISNPQMYLDTNPSSRPASVLGNWAMFRAKKAAMKDNGSYRCHC